MSGHTLTLFLILLLIQGVCLENKTAIVGETVALTCNSTKKYGPGTEWRLIRDGQDDTYIYKDGSVDNQYSNRITVEKLDGENTMILRISDVQTDDAGKYRAVGGNLCQHWLTVSAGISGETVVRDSTKSSWIGLMISSIFVIATVVIVFICLCSSSRTRRQQSRRRHEEESQLEMTPLTQMPVSADSRLRRNLRSCLDFFRRLIFKNGSHINKLPIEVLQPVLLDAFTIAFLSSYKSCESPQDTLHILAIVCRQWSIAVRRSKWFKSQLKLRYQSMCQPFMLKPRLAYRLEPFSENQVWGVTYLDDEILCINPLSHDIQVFNWQHELVRSIPVVGLEKPIDIVACSETKCIFVADWPESSDAGCIWRLSPDREAKKLSLPISFYPVSLSVKSGRLLVSTFTDVVWFGTDEVTYSHIIKCNMNPSHAVETLNGTFIVCGTTRDESLSKPAVIHIIDSSGNILHDYYSVGSFGLSLGLPRHLAVDSSGEHIFVADLNSKHILQLDSQLKLVRVLLSDGKGKAAVDEPQQLQYVERTGQLVVGELGCVKVFQIVKR